MGKLFVVVIHDLAEADAPKPFPIPPIPNSSITHSHTQFLFPILPSAPNQKIGLAILFFTGRHRMVARLGQPLHRRCRSRHFPPALHSTKKGAFNIFKMASIPKTHFCSFILPSAYQTFSFIPIIFAAPSTTFTCPNHHSAL